MQNDIIFEPLKFKNLIVKNRIFRSSVSGRFDNYNGSGSQTRINWEEKFGRAGVGAVISSFVPVTIRGRILPNYAGIDSDQRIQFWRKLGDTIHKYDCKFILQLSHSGRQQDIGGIENIYRKAQSSTNRRDPFHGILCRAMSIEGVKETVQLFADGARRAREAGLDGIELHGANGYLITQFLSSAINDRKDDYDGSLENRARFVLDIIRAIRKEVGDDYHLQVKINAVDHDNILNPFGKRGNTIKESIHICKWIEEAGADAIHVSSGSMFPHPLNPIGGFPLDYALRSYGVVLPSGIYTFRNYLLFRYRVLRPIFLWIWNRIKKNVRPPSINGREVKDTEMQRRLLACQGINLNNALEIKKHVNIPVLCTGGFQQASYIRKAISEEFCDAVTIARPLVANNDLVKIFEQGKDIPDKPCTYCNKCLIYAPAYPLGCYETDRFDGDYDRMIEEVMSVFDAGGI